jgi:hypothetical protein
MHRAHTVYLRRSKTENDNRDTMVYNLAETSTLLLLFHSPYTTTPFTFVNFAMVASETFRCALTS